MFVSVLAIAAATAASTPVRFATSTRTSDAEEPIRRGLPGDRQPFLRMLAVVLDVHAVLAMDHDAAAATTGTRRSDRSGSGSSSARS